MTRPPLLLLVLAAAALPASASASAVPRAARVVLEPAGAAQRLHVELAQAPGAVRRVRLDGAPEPVRLKPVSRRPGRTVWHSPALSSAASAAVARGGTRLRLALREGRTTVLAFRLNGAAGSPGPAPAPTVQSPVDATPQATEITAVPAITPALSEDTTDHVVRCAGDAPVTVSVRSAAPVAVDGGPARTGSFTAAVPLASGQAFSIAVGGVTHRVRCLPADFPVSTAERRGAQEALGYLVTPVVFHPGTRYAAVLDARGTPIWWTAPSDGAIDLKTLPGGLLAWSRFFAGVAGLSPDGAYEVHRPDGTLVRTITVEPPLTTDHHDLQLLPGGNVLLIGYRPRAGADLSPWSGPADATVLDPVVQEIRPDGSLAWEWDGQDDLTPAESARLLALQVIPAPVPGAGGTSWYDTAHPNSVAPDGDGILVSLRNADAVYRIDRATGDVDWKLGGTPTAASLTVIGDPLDGALGGQHDARRLPDGTISVFDNGSLRGRPPRVARYAVDPVARTATLVSAFEDPAVPSSPCCGSARRLPGGHWVVAWGGTPRFTETTADGTVVFALTFAGTTSTYRALPLLPGDDVSLDTLRAGMDAQYPR